MRKWTRPIAILIGLLAVAALVVGDLAYVMAAEQGPTTAVPQRQLIETATDEPVQVAQRRRTLFDLLFGDEEPRREEPVVERPVVRPQQQQQQARPTAALPPPKPTVEKAEGATRLAVFGDSMAVDVARALERLFVDDPNLAIVSQGVGSSGFVRDDFFDWNKTIGEQIAADSFDIAVVIIGINDRQQIGSARPLEPEWSTAYSGRVSSFVSQLRAANKPTIWISLPPMEANSYGQAIGQIGELQKLAVFSGGAEYLDIYERFLDEDGRYSSFGPDLNGNRVRMRKDDGIHFSAAGADKVAFYLNQTLKVFYRGGGGVGIAVADPLFGTDAQLMVRPPYQGLGQIRLLEVAGAVISLTHAPRRALDLVTAGTAQVIPAGFDMNLMVEAPVGRADAFGVGKRPASEMEMNTRGR